MKTAAITSPLLEVHDLKKHFEIKEGFFQKTVGSLKAVDGVSLSVQRGETLGLVGESGCGKSTLGRTILRLHEPTSGKIIFNGHDFNHLQGAELRRMRRHMQMIFQDPYSSLDPRMTVAEILVQPFRIHGLYSAKERRERARALMETVGLKASQLELYPREFSGGQRQRISIARAIALEPDLIIADEPVSALDVSIQAQILNLLKDLQERLKLTLIFISHDLKVVEYFCDRVSVMYLGRIVETASREALYESPLHPYTQALFSSIPSFGTGKKKVHAPLRGEVPTPVHPPAGCSFHPRCSQARPECSEKSPKLISHRDHHDVACWLYPSGRDASLS